LIAEPPFLSRPVAATVIPGGPGYLQHHDNTAFIRGRLSGKVLCAILTLHTDFAIDDKESDDDETTQTGQFRLGD
jgi:hypothetical protein